jgi:hypothetical protein
VRDFVAPPARREPDDDVFDVAKLLSLAASELALLVVEHLKLQGMTFADQMTTRLRADSAAAFPSTG